MFDFCISHAFMFWVSRQTPVLIYEILLVVVLEVSSMVRDRFFLRPFEPEEAPVKPAAIGAPTESYLIGLLPMNFLKTCRDDFESTFGKLDRR